MQREIDERGCFACIYNCMLLAWWRNILLGSGDPQEVEWALKARCGDELLHEAIERVRAGKTASVTGMPTATSHQREEAMSWLCWRVQRALHEFFSPRMGWGPEELSWEESLKKKR